MTNLKNNNKQWNNKTERYKISIQMKCNLEL